MKMQNPFNRLKKKEFVPLSLFPCSKVTRTSMDIGRATPVYTCDMMQGNKISIDAAQLTRFASLSVPTMNEYEVGLGAYFVPYVSFDEFFNNHTINKYSKSNPDFCSYITKCALHARDFFNPALDDSLRVHPLSLPAKFIRGIDVIGSLFDHLGYYTGYNEDVSDTVIYSIYPSVTTTINCAELLENPFVLPNYSYDSQGQIVVGRGMYFDSSVVSDTVAKLPFDVFILNKYVDRRFNNVSNISYDEYIDTFDSYYHQLNEREWKLIMNTFMGTNYDVSITWSDVFGDVTEYQVARCYVDYITSNINMYHCSDFSLNVVRALAYYRIYADWFIDDTLMHKDDFLTLIGGAYTVASLGTDSIFTCFENASSILSADSKALMFVDELKYGRCLPVPSEKNYFTACRPTQTNNTFTDFNFSGNGVAETPVGSTIHENFFNRAYQRFKDFVTRLGYDYRRNTAGIYGHDSNDDSLISSQLFGSVTFDVKVGDIAQTSESSSTSQQGNLAGIAMSKGGSSKWTFTANENGLVMILAWIRPKSTSFAGCIDRSMFKSNYHDYLIPTFGGTCMQDVLVDEIYPCKSNSTDKFGVTEIYSEYMSVNNECSGLMRTTQSKWNADRILKNKPAPLTDRDGLKLMYLNNEWYDDLNRNFMDTETSPILTTLYFTGNVTRQLPEAIRTDF